MTVAWDQFIESVQGGSRDWINSIDLSALAQLQGQELEQAKTLLISQMNITDTRASRALGTLPDPRVLQALEAHLPLATRADRVATASSLLRLGSAKGADAIQAVAEGLANPDILISTEALQAAETSGTAILPALLAAAVTHPLESVRFGAARRALFVSGVHPTLASNDHRADAITLVKGDPAQRRESFERLCGLMKIDLAVYAGPRP